MKNYLDLLKKIMTQGDDRMDRTGVGTRALFTEMLEWDLAAGFPIITTKKMPFKMIVAELLWFLSGSSDNNELVKMGCNIWTPNAEAPYWKDKAKFPGDLGRVYGVQWRSWNTNKYRKVMDAQEGNWLETVTVDQIAELIHKLRTNPYDRRMIVTAYNPGELDQMALPPCHMFFQCFVRKDKLDLTMYQRSCDTFLGVPFNISSYALLTHMLARVTGLKPGRLKIVFGDVHIYNNHFDQVELQLTRTPQAVLPYLVIDDRGQKELEDFKMDDFHLNGYFPAAPIKGEMAV